MKISWALKIVAVGALVLATAGASEAQPLMVVRNNMVRVALTGSAASVIVGNPGVADVNVVDSRTIYVIGRGYGQSAVTILDRNGHAIYDNEVVVTAEPQNAVTVYHGSKPQIMLCAHTCTAEVDTGSSGGGDSGGSAAPVIPMISSPAAPAGAVSPGAAVAISQ